MESKFTKGPWVVKTMPTENDFGIVSIGEYEISGQSFYDIINIGEDGPIEETANLKLIAAAPDLLEALQAAKTELEMYIPVTDVKVLQQIQAAIAKALD